MSVRKRTSAEVLENLFARAIRQGDCLISHIKPNTKGYVYISLGGRDGQRIRANRFVYKKCNGPLHDDELVRHTCDTRNCIEPLHLIKGTSADNSSDMVERNRAARLGRPAIPDSLLLQAVEMKQAGYTNQQIADVQGLAGPSSVKDRLRRARDVGIW